MSVAQAILDEIALSAAIQNLNLMLNLPERAGLAGLEE